MRINNKSFYVQIDILVCTCRNVLITGCSISVFSNDLVKFLKNEQKHKNSCGSIR